MKRVLITGITGFIGSHLAEALLPDCQVYGLVREPVNGAAIAPFRDRLHLLRYDGSYVSAAQALETARPELVYHLATYYTGKHGPEDTPKLIASNIVLGANLLEAMAASGSPALVYASTVMECGGGAEYAPLNLYAATKRAFVDLVTYYTDAGLLRALGLMLSDTYGPGDRRPKLLNLIRSAAASGEPLPVSAGTQHLDLVHVEDVVRALLLAGNRILDGGGAAHERFQVYDRETPPTLRQIAETLCRFLHPAPELLWGARPMPPPAQRLAVRRFPLLPGFRCGVSLEDGLRRFAREDNPERI